ncbi:integrase core domain-containing protein [bacterium]|nr:integrase core domain-containing protein [bacterium]
MYQIVIRLLSFFLIVIRSLFKSEGDLLLENLSLRQQLAMFKSRNIKPKITNVDRSFWVALMRVWTKWIDSLIIVKPETVIDWQKRRFKKHWTKISTRNKKPGRKRLKKEIRELIYLMAGENRWGAPRIYSELLMLGFDDVSEAAVSRYLRTFKSKHPEKKKQQSWMPFLKNHRDVISAMDFFVVPTINLKSLFVFFIIDHKRRIIRHFNVTNHPSAQWVIQQLRDAFPFDQVPKYLIMDRDTIFSSKVRGFLEQQLGIKPKITSYKSPWQNGIAERLVLSIREDLLNHVIIFNEDHLRRLMNEYVKYYNNDRCHLSLGRDSPLGRNVQEKPSESGKIISISKLGGIQHRYEWKEVA